MVIDYGKLIFGNVDSSEYGIYVSGEGVYNAPQRAVEFVKVPGRNGDIAMDQGRFENITVTYPAMYIGDDQEEFREKLMEYRNAIMSQKGYQRLEDSYHPEEYRMGVYADGLEVDSVYTYQIGGEFKLTFNCKPQRWLTVGALPIPVDSGDVLQNPTPFDAGPLLEIDGYGDVSFNGYTVSLENAVLGETLLIDSFFQNGVYDPSTISNTTIKTITLDGTLFNIGDVIKVAPTLFRSSVYTKNVFIASRISSGSGSAEGSVSIPWPSVYENGFDVEVSFTEIEFTAGTSSIKTYTGTATAKDINDNVLSTITLEGRIEYNYIQGNHSISFYCKATTIAGVYAPQGAENWAGRTTVNSTLSLLGNPTYVDCDLGEAYRIVDGTPASLNSKVTLGSDLPVLAPGSNKITFDNTITDLKIAPRWWRI